MNILVTGSPGVGKSLFSEQLQAELARQNIDSRILNVSQLVKDEKLYDEYDDVLDTIVMDDKKVKKRLKELLGGDDNIIIETHSVDIVPKSLIDVVFVLRVSDTAVYYDRLAARGYPEAKINENVDCEIMQVVWMDAVDRFGDDLVSVFSSQTPEEMTDAIKEAVEILLQE